MRVGASLEVRFQGPPQQTDGHAQAALGGFGRRIRPQRLHDLIPRENAARPGEQQLQERAGLLPTPLSALDRNPSPQDLELAEEVDLEARRFDHIPSKLTLDSLVSISTITGQGTERIPQMGDFFRDSGPALRGVLLARNKSVTLGR